jgi:hypothetical protein
MGLPAARVGHYVLSQSVRAPRFHRSPLVRHAEVREHGVAGANVLDFAAALELPPDRVLVRLTQKARGGITITASS